jgi:chromosome transmission fidelity protein 8
MSETIKIRTRHAGARGLADIRNPLPHVIRTPAGLARLEIQGTINLLEKDDEGTMRTGEGGVEGQETPIGRLVFDGYEEGQSDGAWMKKVYMYVGKHQWR